MFTLLPHSFKSRSPIEILEEAMNSLGTSISGGADLLLFVILKYKVERNCCSLGWGS